MEVLYYDELGDAYFDRILDEAECCQDCDTKDDLALVVVTSEHEFGSLILICTKCHVETEDLEIQLEKSHKRLYV